MRWSLGAVVFTCAMRTWEWGHHYRLRNNTCKCPEVAASSLCSQISKGEWRAAEGERSLGRDPDWGIGTEYPNSIHACHSRRYSVMMVIGVLGKLGIEGFGDQRTFEIIPNSQTTLELVCLSYQTQILRAGLCRFRFPAVSIHATCVGLTGGTLALFCRQLGSSRHNGSLAVPKLTAISAT